MTELIDSITYYIKNLDINHFIFNFFGKKKITQVDYYIIEKINQLQQDFPSFWLSLDDDNKQLFIKVIQLDNHNTIPKVKFPKNLNLVYSNGKQLFEFN